jgi:hypothetical protein
MSRIKREENFDIERHRTASSIEKQDRPIFVADVDNSSQDLYEEYTRKADPISLWKDPASLWTSETERPSLATDPPSVWTEDLREIRARDWQKLDFPSHNPLVRSEDEVRVFRFKAAKLAADHVANRRIIEVVATYLSEGTEPTGRSETDLILGSTASDPASVNSPTVGSARLDPVGKYQRMCWLILTVGSLIWGGVSGASFSINGFPVPPPAALAGALGLIVLALTLLRLGKAAQ